MPTQKESTLNAYMAWYPPVQQTLLCLSKMYRCIDARIFGGLAQEAVSAATATAQAASRLVAKRASQSGEFPLTDARASRGHGHLDLGMGAMVGIGARPAWGPRVAHVAILVN